MITEKDLNNYTQKFKTTSFYSLYDRKTRISRDNESTFYDLSLKYSTTNGDLVLQFYDVRKGKFIEEFAKRFELFFASEALFTFYHLKRLLKKRLTEK